MDEQRSHVNKHTYRYGFTIVELLIVIVIVTYTGAQMRARDSRRQSDTRNFAVMFERYYIDNGKYPTSGGSTAINAAWSTTADASWQTLADQLRPYMPTTVADPISTPSVSVLSGGIAYDYAYLSGNYCGTTGNQMYTLVHRYENVAQVNKTEGACTAGTTLPLYPSRSNMLIVR